LPNPWTQQKKENQVAKEVLENKKEHFNVIVMISVTSSKHFKSISEESEIRSEKSTLFVCLK